MTASGRVEISGVGKSFNGVTVLSDVTVTIEAGTIHALVGENGAGKSTLGGILAGTSVRDNGTLTIDGVVADYRTPRGALAHGIALVHQEISLVPSLSVEENIFLGCEDALGGIVNARSIRRRYEQLTARTGFSLDARQIVGELSIAHQQQVEIMRALARNAKVIIFDEPTAALDTDDTARLHAVLQSLRDAGTTVLLVSHFLTEVLALATTITVLKDGAVVRTSAAMDESVPTLIGAMLGRSMDEMYPPKPECDLSADAVLVVDGLSRTPGADGQRLSIRPGEIVAIAGLEGSGRTEFARQIFGAGKRATGRVIVAGTPVRMNSPRAAIDAGLAYVPANRRDDALIPMRPFGENLTLAIVRRLAVWGVIARTAELARIRDAVSRFDIRPADSRLRIDRLSGGNQQKVVLARSLSLDPRVLIIDEPTRGVDVGAKGAIYDLLRIAVVERSMAIVLISGDLDEISGLAHRILVMRDSQIVAELPGDASHPRILEAAFGSPGGAQ